MMTSHRGVRRLALKLRCLGRQLGIADIQNASVADFTADLTASVRPTRVSIMMPTPSFVRA
jgi:hypothetical protein